MKEEKKAFFYQNEYYLFPDGVEDVEELSAFYDVEVTKLLKKGCKPPDFKREETENVLLTISGPAYETYVNVWDEREYEEKFGALSKQKCARCKRSACMQNEREKRAKLSLGGTCYMQKSDGDEKAFGDGIRTFVNALAERADYVKTLIDQNEQKELDELLNGLLNEFFVPMETYGGRNEKGDYVLCFSAKEYAIEGITTALLALVKGANAKGSPVKDAGLFLFPFLPRGIYAPKLSPDYYKKPPRIFYRFDEDTESCEIEIYEKKACEWSESVAKKRTKNAYRYLCFAIGEDLLCATASRVQIVSEIPSDKRELNVEELLATLYESVADTYHDGFFPYPNPFVLEPTVEPKNTTPYKENFKVWITACPELAPSLSPVGEEDEELFEAAFRGAAVYGILSSVGIGYAYVYLPNGGTLEDKNRYAFEDCLEDELQKRPLRGATVCVPVGVVGTDKGICLDFLVLDEGEFFDVLQGLAPLLSKINAKIVTVKGTESTSYDAGFEIIPEDREFLS